MNSKIFAHIKQKLQQTWHLPRHQHIRDMLDADTVLESLPWTPGRKQKFVLDLENTFNVSISLEGTVRDLVARTDDQYMCWFFSEVWKPRTDRYHYTGWWICDEINKTNPQRVLDVGCGYHPFKNRIANLVGIDPYNDCADYQVDIMDYSVEPASFDHIIALGSINFGSRSDIEEKFVHVISLLAPGGHLWMRANPGLPHKTGPWVDIFPWSFDVAYDLAKKFDLDLKTLKKDQDRLFILFVKKR